MTRTHPFRARGRRGYTLAELLIVLVLIGLAASLAVPRMSRWVQTVSSRTAVNHVMTDLALTRVQAARTGATVSLRIENSGARYRITVDNAAGAEVREVKRVEVSRLFPGTTLEPATGRIAFDSRGILRDSPVTTTRQVTLRRGDVTRVLSISQLGKVQRGLE